MTEETDLLMSLGAMRVTHPRSGKLIWRGGGLIELWFAEGHTLAKRRALIEVFKTYHEAFAERITHYLPNDGSRLVRLEGGAFPDHFDRIVETIDPDLYFDGALKGYDETTEIGEATPWAIEGAGIWNRDPDKLSSVTAYVPGDWMVADFDRFVALAHRMAGVLNAEFGLAGPGLVRDFSSPPYSMNDDRAFPFLKRFPGLDYSDAPMFALATRKAPPALRLRSVNWLTLLGPGHLEALGGREVLQALAVESIETGIAGAVLVRSGERPGIGDLNEGRSVDAYGPIARLTAPLRFEGYTSKGLFRVPAPLDEVEETLAWVRRFD